MAITKHHSGRYMFQFDRVIDGVRQRENKVLPKGWTLAEANKFDQQETSRLYARATGVRAERAMIEDAVKAYLESHAVNLKNQKDVRAALEILKPFYKGKAVDQLGEVGQAYGKKVGDSIAPATLRNRLAYLRAACRWAWKNKKLGQHDPAEGLVLPKVSNARHVYLTREQVLPVFRAMGVTFSRDAARVAFYTGWRISEVLRATPVDTPSGLALVLLDSKNGLPRMVPVHQKIEHLVRRHWPLNVTKWTVSKETKKALRACELGHVRLHDLRHSAASEMINAGIDLYTVGGVLGHKSQVSTSRYAHLAQGRLKMAIRAIGGRKLQPASSSREA